MVPEINQHAMRWRALLAAPEPRKPEKGLEKLWLAGEGVVARMRQRPARYLALARQVDVHREAWRSMTEDELREHAQRLRRAWTKQDPDRAARIDSLALVRERARRELGMEPFVVQVAGAAALLDGSAIEMATGEGKTLVAALAAVLIGWRGRGCHIVTVNDYLVERDAGWMGVLYRSCGVSVGFVKESSTPDSRRQAYARDVTYATNKELAADHLRDRILMQERGDPTRVLLDAATERRSPGGAGLLMRGLECAIVDEADAILIDEAVTPLIISGPAGNEESEEAARRAASLCDSLRKGEHYSVDQRFHEVRLTKAGRKKLADRGAELGGVWRGVRRAEELMVYALTARELYQRERQYIVNDGRVVIVDEFTGRLMPDRMWRNGLHQAVEAKEGLSIQPMKDTLARISFQRFFRSYRRLCGMTGTARESRGELWTTYRLPVVPIPTNKPCLRMKLRSRHCADAETRREQLLHEIEEVHGSGRPVLVGARTVERSEELSAALRERRIPHHVLNAVRHEKEAEIISRAGEASAVTIATNMAGRGTDIKLGEGVSEKGGLHVIVTEPHESARIDRQFFGRSSRQGDPGSARLYAAFDDELLLKNAARGVRVARILGYPAWLSHLVLHWAQRRAESLARRRRAAVMRTDDWLERGLGFAGPGRV